MCDINITETPINHLDKEMLPDPTIVCPLTLALSPTPSLSLFPALYLSLSLFPPPHFDLSVTQ